MCVQDKEMDINGYLACSPITEGGPFQWEGISFSLVKMLHTGEGCKNPYSFGLVITDEARSIFISTDTQFRPGLLEEIAERVDLMFHDCETQRSPSRSCTFRRSVHFASGPKTENVALSLPAQPLPEPGESRIQRICCKRARVRFLNHVNRYDRQRVKDGISNENLMHSVAYH